MPTIKQKIAFKEVVEGSSLSEGMRIAKYSVETSKRTNKLTRTRGWKELMDSYLPDRDLAKAHKEGLKAGRKIFKNNNATKQIEEVGFEPDYSTRHKYLETAYKIKNKFPKDGIGVAVQFNFNSDRDQYA